MSDDNWQELSPWNLKKTDDPRATIRAAIMGKHKAPVVYIGINRSLCNELQWDTNGTKLAKIDVGTKENLGKMRIQPSDKGRFRLSCSGPKGSNNGIRLVMRLPGQPASTSRPQIIDHRVDGHAVILSIPQEWADVVQVKPYSKSSEPVVGKPIEKMWSKAHPDPNMATIVVKPDILKIMTDEIKKSSDPPPIKTVEKRTANVTQSPCVHVMLSGRILIVGQTPINLMADEINITRTLYEKFGETLTKKAAALIEKKPDVPIDRLTKKLNGMRIAIEQRDDGWAMVNRVAT